MKIPPLTPEQQQLVSENVGLAYNYANQIMQKQVLHSRHNEEIVHRCLLALCRAATSYDPTIAKFSTYAVNGMKMAIRTLRWEVYKKKQVPVLNAESISHDEELNILRLIGDRKEPGRRLEYQDEINARRRYANECEWEIIEKIYFEGWTRAEVARYLGLSKERVRQILDRGLYGMREREYKPPTPKGHPPKDLTGKRVHMLVPIEMTERRAGSGSIVWKCRCDCGNICFKSSNSLNPKHSWVSYSCGCTRNPNPMKSKYKKASRPKQKVSPRSAVTASI